GAQVFTFQVAGVLFAATRPICPACLKPTAGEPALLACAACGALHHDACGKKGCALVHEGAHDCVPEKDAPALTKITTGVKELVGVHATATSTWARVRRAGEDVPPDRRLLWRLDATTPALGEKPGFAPGACFELAHPGVGDSLARVFSAGYASGLG